ncbi:hypothetical protein BH24BAC1_BH24BAC1_39920 [soil metagenome]
MSVPVWWLDLGRLGISGQWHRKLLLRLALRVLDLRGKALLADREYVGEEWFGALRQAGIELVIRLARATTRSRWSRRAGRWPSSRAGSGPGWGGWCGSSSGSRSGTTASC